MSITSIPKTHSGTTVRCMFIVTFIALLASLNVTVGVVWVARMDGLGLARFMILQIVNINVAYGLTELVFYLLTKRTDLPSAPITSNPPRVALLYTTCDDVVPAALARLGSQSYVHCDVFVLDDSTTRDARGIVDESGFLVVRRGSRQGFKAGNLNNWLTRFGGTYDYIAVLDSDSILDEDFVARMVAYAEHPENSDVAVFQSRIRVWNLDSSFARALSVWYPLWYAWTEKTANRCETVFSWGHNCLYRLPPLVAAGGFNEEYIAEDYATCVGLMQKGHRCRFVDVVSYEAAPALMRDYTKRATRWARQTLQLFAMDMSGLPVTSRLHVFMNGYSFAIWTVFVPGMFLAIWGTQSSPSDVVETVRLLATTKFLRTPMAGPVFVMLFFNMYFLLGRLPVAARLGIPWRDYFSTMLLLIAMGPYLMVPLVCSQIGYVLLGRKIRFEVTKKVAGRPSFLQILSDMRWGLLLMSLVVLGLLRNPAGLLWNFPWLIPFIGSPLIIYAAETGKLCWSAGKRQSNPIEGVEA